MDYAGEITDQTLPASPYSGAALNAKAAEEAAWQHGRAAFILTGSQGTCGKPTWNLW